MNIDMLPMKLAFLTHGLLYYNNNNNNVTEKLSKYKDLELEIERMWGGESYNNSSSDRSPGTNKERIGEIYPTDHG